MKFNKKLVVASLSTVLGLGIVGSISGTVAWYQYSTRTTASIIGVSSAEAGMLQIKTPSSSDWSKKDLYTADLKGSNSSATLYPVTFGGFAKNAALPSKAYKNPESGDFKMNVSKYEASAAKEYIQYTVNLRAVNAAGEQVEKDVYISDLVLEDAATSGTLVTSALRMHIATSAKNFLVAPGTTARELNCYGKLDLNGDGANDNANDGKYEWQKVDNPAELDYGFYAGEPEALVEAQQTTYLISEVVNARNSDGTITASTTKKLGTTPTTGSLDVTVTIWLEGWEGLGSPASVIWNGATVGHTIHAGLTFDIGAGAFSA